MREVKVGDELGGYRIEQLIGHGGMGVVYRATQLRLSRTVALKVIMPALASDVEFRARFESESRLAASIDHSHVVPIYEADEVEGLLFIVMRHVDGQDLRSLIDSEGALAPERAARIVSQVGSALDAAHSRGLVHRDVKPGNVLITGPAGGEHAYLTDFGLTKRMADQGLTKTGQWVGTLDYAAPEQIDGRPVDARTDVYALGCVLYHALTGEVPFVRDSDVAKMYAHLHDPAPTVSEVKQDTPEAMAKVVARSMAKEPDERFPSAGDFARAAVAAADGDLKDVSERSVATGDAAPAGATRRSARPAAAATTPAQQPEPQAPAPATAVPQPTPATAAPQPTPATAAPQPTPATVVPQPTPTPLPEFGGRPAAPTGSSPDSGGSGNRGLLIAVVALLAALVIGGGAYAVLGSGDDEPGPGPVADTTPTAEPTATVTTAATQSAAPSPTPTQQAGGTGIGSDDEPCQNLFISDAERRALPFAQGISDQAVDGSVFYGVCEGETWAIASFPDGSTGVFRQFGQAWNRLGSLGVARCRVPNALLTQWRQPLCVQGE